ncbi:MAG: transcription termination/antitermination protein NusG [bacterium]|nr:transcription termination/antitermination protein NusG [bacterium]
MDDANEQNKVVAMIDEVVVENSIETVVSAESQVTAAVPVVAEKVKPPKKVELPLNDISDIKDGMDWFVVHVYSGFEQKVKTSLKERIKSHNMEAVFGAVLVPQEQVIEMVRGQKKTSNKKFFPGYMMVQMTMNRDTWHLVKETPKVTGFIGDETNPDPLTKEEVERLVKQVSDTGAAPRASMNFQQGESVKVVDGPFVDFNGTVDEVRPEKGKLRVLISIFGRATPVELDFSQVERLA